MYSSSPPSQLGFYAIESQGLSGGIIVLWEQKVDRVNVFHRCFQQVAIVITEFNGHTWLLFGMYIGTDYREWRILW